MIIATSKQLKGDNPETRLVLISDCLDNEKADDISFYDLHDKSQLADYMVIATGRSTTHVKALAKKLVEKCKSKGIRDIKTEGDTHGDWVLVDVGDVIVHLFRDEVRRFYDMDKLWEECGMDNAPKSLESATAR